MYRKNTAGQFFTFQLVLAASGAAGTGLTPALRRCIDGTFAAAGGTATEDGSTGWYKFAMTQADTNGNDIGFGISATGCIPVSVNFITTAADPTDSVRFGLTGLANAVPGATGGLAIVGSAMTVTSNIKKNQASATPRSFPMFLAGTRTLATGKTVTVSRMIDGSGSFTVGSLGAVSEAGTTGYYIMASYDASDVNGNQIDFVATASGCDSTVWTYITTP
jgi:hypothetical protein